MVVNVQQVDDIARWNGCFVRTTKICINFTALWSMYQTKFIHVILAADEQQCKQPSLSVSGEVVSESESSDITI